MGFGRYVLHRLLLVAPTLFGVTLISFTLVYVLPGNPALVKAGSLPTPSPVPASEPRMGPARPLPRLHGGPPTRPLLPARVQSSIPGQSDPVVDRRRAPRAR